MDKTKNGQEIGQAYIRHDGVLWCKAIIEGMLQDAKINCLREDVQRGIVFAYNTKYEKR